MVTRNPALTLRWDDRLGSSGGGEDRRPPAAPASTAKPALGLLPTVYRDLIDATEREVELVLVGGDPLAGEMALMSALKPGDYEVVASPAGGFRRRSTSRQRRPVPEGDEALADFWPSSGSA